MRVSRCLVNGIQNHDNSVTERGSIIRRGDGVKCRPVKTDLMSTMCVGQSASAQNARVIDSLNIANLTTATNTHDNRRSLAARASIAPVTHHTDNCSISPCSHDTHPRPRRSAKPPTAPCPLLLACPSPPQRPSAHRRGPSPRSMMHHRRGCMED
jgi:hypothetical protein